MQHGILLDADYEVKNSETFIALLLKVGKKTSKFLFKYEPYFYVDCPEDKIASIEKVVISDKFGNKIKPTKIEVVELEVDGEKKKILKVFCKTPSEVPLLKEVIPFRAYEYNITFRKRFFLDFSLDPFSEIEFEAEGNLITSFSKSKDPESFELNKLSFDIETYNPLGAPRMDKDPIIMISYKGETKGVLTYKKIPEKKFVHTCKDEAEMIGEFCKIVSSEDPDVIYGYNSTNFDLPYLYERSKALRIPFEVGRGKSDYRAVRHGFSSGLSLDGRTHLDLYPLMRLFGIIGIVKTKKFTLEAIYAEISKGKKGDINRNDIWKLWDKHELDNLAEYALIDSEATYDIGENFLPLCIELSKLTGLPLFDISLATSGQMVEFLLMKESVKRGMIIPSRPHENMIKEREENPVQGAFVKLPEPGIYENLAVMDFRGLYPSIIISYNVDPYMLTTSTDNTFKSPEGHHFKKSPLGLIPSVLGSLVEKRIKIKSELKKHKKGTPEYTKLEARSQALKIISNSFYGYLLYARSRWYNRACGESVTAWGRQHIQETIKKAEECGFKVIYGDTDSTFVSMENKTKKDVLEFMEKINKSLPDQMELELEGFFPRGVFVGKKTGEKGAKKKYALLAEDGSFKIRGFELVRRDWSKIAKDTQRKVLEAILKEGSKEKAIAIVRDVIEQLRSGKVSKEELTIYTQLNKDPHKYDIASPELAAAKKAIKKGMQIEKGSLIAFIICKAGKSISEKATPVEFAEDYDIDYYINRQILPSVMKILKELGCSEEDLKFGGKQKGIGDFF